MHLLFLLMWYIYSLICLVVSDIQRLETHKQRNIGVVHVCFILGLQLGLDVRRLNVALVYPT